MEERPAADPKKGTRGNSPCFTPITLQNGNCPQSAEPTDVSEVARMEWVPLASVPELVAEGKIWSAGTLVGLLLLIAAGRLVLQPDFVICGERALDAGRPPFDDHGL